MQPRPPGGNRRYDVFISYSHPQRAMAMAVERQVKKIGKPWYGRSRLRVFRDDSVLAAGPDLWAPIETGLGLSSHFLAIASPEAAGSPWVEREVRWWLDNRGSATMLIAVAAGSIAWSSQTGSFADGQTTCLTPSLLRAFRNEPHWVDLRGVEVDEPGLMPVCAGITAAITGRSKDEVLSEDRRQRRRTRRTIAAALAIISCLAVVAVIAGIAAVSEKNRAEAAARIASARAFLANAVANRGTDLHSALLDAAAAQRLHDDQRSGANLLSTLTDQPRLHRFIADGFAPTSVTWAPQRDLLVQGGRDAVRISAVDGAGSRTVPVSGTVTSLASSGDGTTVAAGLGNGELVGIDTATARALWTVHTGLPGIAAAAIDAGVVAAASARGRLEVLAAASGQLLWQGSYRSTAAETDISYLSVLQHGDAVLAGTPTGQISVQSRFPGRQSPWTDAQVADIQPPSAYVDSEGALTFAYPFPTGIQFRTLQGRRVVRSYPAVPYGDASAFAMTPDRHEVALAADGRLILLSASDSVNPSGTATVLTGVSVGVGSELAFSPDGAYLASTSGTTTAIWTITRASGLATTIPRYLPAPCRACGSASAVLDERAGTLVYDEYGTDFGAGRFVCWDLGKDRVRATLSSPDVIPGQTLLVTPGDTALMTGGEGIGPVEWQLENGCPTGSPRPVVLHGVGASEQSSFAPALNLRDGSTVGTVDNGRLLRRTAASAAVPVPGARVATFPFRVLVASPDRARFIASLSSRGQLAQFELTGSDTLRRTWTVRLSRSIDSAIYTSTNTIAVATDDGQVSLWDATSGRKIENLNGSTGYQLAATSDGHYLLGVTGHQTDVAVWSLRSGALATTFDFAPFALGLDSPLRAAAAAAQFATLTLADNHDGIWFLLAGAEPTRWELNDGSFRALACAQAGDDLTRAQWTDVTGTSPPGSTSCLASN